MAGRIAGIVVEIGGDTTKLTKALSGVNKSINQTQTALKDVGKLLKLDPSNTELLQQKQKLLKEAIAETRDKLQTLQAAAKSSDLGTAEHDAIQREIAETEQKLAALEKEYRNFGSVAAQQLAVVGQKMQDVGAKVSQIGDSIAGFGKSLSMRVTMPLVAVGTAGTASFAEVDKTMQLANKTMGNTSQQAGMLDDAMKTAAANSVYGMNDAATAALNFARAGLDAGQAASALAPAMNLAAGEGGNLDVVSAGLVATINGFHGAFADAERYADVFASACNNSALDVDSLSNAMSVAAPIFSAAGYSVEDAALYMGVMANNGIEADKAANSLKTGIARLVSPAKEGATMMEKLGLSVTNADGSMKDSVTIQRELHDAFAQLSESEQIAAASAIFGKNQMAPWLALINSAPSDVGTLNNALRQCGGTTQEMADTMMGGFGGSIEKLKSSIDVLTYSLGQALAPTIQKVVDYIQGLVDKFNALSPAQQQMITRIGLIVAAIGPALTVFGKLVKVVGDVTTKCGVLMTKLPQIQGFFKAFGGPILAAVAIISTLVAAFKHLWETNEEFREKITAIWDGLKAKFEAFGQGIVDRLNSLGFNFQSITEVMKKVWDGFCNLLAPVFEGAFSAVSTILSTVFDVITGILDVFIGLFTGNWSQLWDGIKEIFSGIWDGISGVFSTAVDTIRGIADTILGWFGSDWNSAWESVKSFFEDVWNGICGFFSGVWTSIVNTVSGAVETARAKISAAWALIKAATSTVFNAVKTTISNVWNGIKNTVSTVASTVFNTIRDKFNAAKNTVSSIFGSIKQTISDKINAAKQTVKDVIDKIKGFFNFSWSLPKLKMPHLTITGGFSIMPPRVPQFSISWYQKAMDNAMVLDNATIFGMASGRMLGGGEAGREVVSGESHLIELINDAVNNALGARLDNVLDLLDRYLPGCASARIAIPTDSIDQALTNRAARRAAAW